VNDWEQRARSFGSVADAYDRFRPGYPDALLDGVAALGPRVLEAGAGTGRATVALAARGCSVVGVEPDPAMAAVARRATAGMEVQVIESAFEDFETDGGFDLVVSAQAWHWVDPDRGLARAAAALEPGGTMCAWWNRPADLGGATWAAIEAAYAEHAPELSHSHLNTPSPLPEMPQTAAFTPWTVRKYRWTALYDAPTYTGMVATHSDHVLLEPERRARLLEAVAAAIDATDGQLEYRYVTLLLSAQVHR
jgi:SAM-dependent methyltransferase